MKQRQLTLLLLTFSVLMLELTLIRWIAAQIRIAAYFPNLVLIAAFFGMGLGCLRQSKRSLFWLFPVGLLLLTVLVSLGSHIAFTAKGSSEHFWLLYYNLPEDAPVINNILAPLGIIFLLVAIVFMPLGQAVGKILDECQKANQTLIGYAFDLGGSLIGVVLFTLLSLWQTFPWLWFTLAMTPVALLLHRQYAKQGIYAALVAVIVLVVIKAETADAYSPYYALQTYEQNADNGQVLGRPVLTNGSLHQVMLPLQRTEGVSSAYADKAFAGFQYPYSLLKQKPKRALVLGAGTGNDVSMLLMLGVDHIDAVEIDPQILAYGRELHPDQPYSDPRVTPHTEDARSFLNHSQEKYDVIIFGTLDSMTRLSALSNVRLDNFVYTRESIESAKRLLADDGGLILHFMVSDAHISSKIIAMITETFGEFPVINAGEFRLFNQSFMAGPAFAHVAPEMRKQQTQQYLDLTTNTKLDIPTDDWPYLYVTERGISPFYLKMIAVVLFISIVLFVIATPREPGQKGLLRTFDAPMFLFGAAFLLLNTKSVTEIGLLWGNTWMTNSIAFASILLLLLISTLVFAYKPFNEKACFILLFLTLAALYLAPLSALLGVSTGLKLAGSIVFIGAPFFFAGACFAAVFKGRTDVASGLGWNVIGALCGGLLEYINMLTGFKALYLLVLTFYLIAFLLYLREEKATANSAVKV
ncbi:hypothetical protein [Cerasicoccus maritimus]|uniref:spermine/spermidine synthase domain-containing protein n=1 Tax=Cerasicoccus maritimus TaxID=490089 RepID=UPI0028528904|nr:hypothetical protein [Cerasicoccus maritimus]